VFSTARWKAAKAVKTNGYVLVSMRKISIHEDDSHLYIVLASTPPTEGSNKYVTWLYNHEDKALYQGHYNLECTYTAYRDYYLR